MSITSFILDVITSWLNSRKKSCLVLPEWRYLRLQQEEVGDSVELVWRLKRLRSSRWTRPPGSELGVDVDRSSLPLVPVSRT